MSRIVPAEAVVSRKSMPSLMLLRKIPTRINRFYGAACWKDGLLLHY